MTVSCVILSGLEVRRAQRGRKLQFRSTVHHRRHTTDDARRTAEKLGKIFGGSAHHANPAPYRDRLDVYGLAILGDVKEKDRVGLCIMHQMSEIVFRKKRLGGERCYLYTDLGYRAGE
jgi:hypothetical protein